MKLVNLWCGSTIFFLVGLEMQMEKPMIDLWILMKAFAKVTFVEYIHLKIILWILFIFSLLNVWGIGSRRFCIFEVYFINHELICWFYVCELGSTRWVGATNEGGNIDTFLWKTWIMGMSIIYCCISKNLGSNNKSIIIFIFFNKFLSNINFK